MNFKEGDKIEYIGPPKPFGSSIHPSDYENCYVAEVMEPQPFGLPEGVTFAKVVSFEKKNGRECVGWRSLTKKKYKVVN